MFSSAAFGQAVHGNADEGGTSLLTPLLIIAALSGVAFLVYRRFFAGEEKRGLPPRSSVSPRKRFEKKETPTSSASDPNRIDRPSPRSRPESNVNFEAVVSSAPVGPSPADVRLKKKLQKIQYSNLPINSFTKVKPSRAILPLTLSDDESLLCAIDQMREEHEADEDLRNLSLRILAAFKTRNAVETLSQAAIYDLSSGLRSKAVSILTDFDHESVFEPILLACADPSREVRATAARGIFRLSLNRADAWTRIAETNDVFRMRSAVRAATEANFVRNSFDRLVHEDLKIAYEAFTLAVLIVRSGETDPIFEALREHSDPSVKHALIHVLGIVGDETIVEPLSKLLSEQVLTADLAEKAGDLMRSRDAVLLETF